MKARPLFSIAALFNFIVGVPMLVAYPVVAPLLQIEGPPTVWFHIVAAIVVIFGVAYWSVARDPLRFRPYVPLAIAAKLAFVAAIYGHWVAGDVSAPSAALVTGDLIFALLFIAYLRGSRPASQPTGQHRELHPRS